MIVAVDIFKRGLDSRTLDAVNYETVIYRDNVVEADAENIRRIVESSGFFFPYEVEVAVDLVKERLVKGISSGYYFLFAEHSGMVIGYTCFGPAACTEASYEVYWIAVHKDFHGLGIGKNLLRRAEHTIAQLGGRRIYVETSSRKQYDPARLFYNACGYHKETELKDFYATGDAKVIYVKQISS